jgi:ribosomal protein S18 acetylase RimI-like enzyme
VSTQSIDEPGIHPLDDPIRGSLRGAHSRFARTVGNTSRFDPEVSPFLGHPTVIEEADFDDIIELFGPDQVVSLRGVDHRVPAHWHIVDRFELVQLVGHHLDTRPHPDAVVLGASDVPEMLELVKQTKPGPFLPRTHELGTYLGIRESGRLAAMAGERMRPAGWTEISAVCTDAAYRGRGLATELVRAVGHGIRERGEIPFLHASASNERAIRLYLSIGFELRQRSLLTLVRTPSRSLDGGPA